MWKIVQKKSSKKFLLVELKINENILLSFSILYFYILSVCVVYFENSLNPGLLLY